MTVPTTSDDMYKSTDSLVQSAVGLAERVIAQHGSCSAADALAFSSLTSYFLEQPQLLDTCLERMVAPLAGILLAQALTIAEQGVEAALEHPPDVACLAGAGLLLWQLATVRGSKTVVRFFPHDATHLEPVLALALYLEKAARRSSAGASASPEAPAGGTAVTDLWQAETVSLLWLSMLVLAPFDLSSLDWNAGEEEEGDEQEKAPSDARRASPPEDLLAYDPPASAPLLDRLLGLGMRCLARPTRCREVSARGLGALLARKDASPARDTFEAWCRSVLLEGGASSQALPSAAGEVSRAGALQALACVLRSGEPTLVKSLARTAVVGALSTPASANLALERKVRVKVLQRAMLALLSAEPFAAEQTPFLDAPLNALLAGLRDRDTIVRWSAAKGAARVCAKLPASVADQVLAELLGGAAGEGEENERALGEESGTDDDWASLARLSSPLLCHLPQDDAAWHGTCLALAECARRRLLRPAHFPRFCALVSRALGFEIRRGSAGVGGHVRDAAAYAAWSLARAYQAAEPEALARAAEALRAPLLVAACYDREVGCRRAAAAAFQELVGRLGSERFPDGIRVLVLADFYTVAVRSKAFLNVAPAVAEVPGYLVAFVRHLLDAALRHWDAAVRELAARALGRLAGIEPGRFAELVLPRLVQSCLDDVLEVRHGAIAATAALLTTLSDAGVRLDQALSLRIQSLVPELEQRRLVHGKGGDVVRAAVCRLIASIASTGLTPPSADRHKLSHQLKEAAFSSAPATQRAAVAGARAFCSAYLGSQASGSERVQVASVFLSSAVEKGISPNARRGCIDVLGCFPTCMLLEDVGLSWEIARSLAVLSGSDSVEALLQPLGVLVGHGGRSSVAPLPTPMVTIDDAACRAAAVSALARLACAWAGVEEQQAEPEAPAERDENEGANAPSTRECAASTQPDRSTQFAALGTSPAAQAALGLATRVALGAMEDYAVDSRGDVGSWVREAGMAALVQVVPLLKISALEAEPSWAGDVDAAAIAPLCLSQTSAAAQAVPGCFRQAVGRIARTRSRALASLHGLCSIPGASEALGPSCLASVREAVGRVSVEQAEEPGGSLATLRAMLRALNEPALTSALLEGVAFSLGGRDGALARDADLSLREALKLATQGHSSAPEGPGAPPSPHRSTQAELSRSLLALWAEFEADRACDAAQDPRRHASAQRKAIPLLALTGALLCPEGILGCDLALHERLLAHVVDSVRRCADISRLGAACDALARLVASPARGGAVRGLLRLAAGRFPTVRAGAADALYAALLLLDDPEGRADEAAEVVAETVWDGDRGAAEEAAQRVLAVMGVDM